MANPKRVTRNLTVKLLPLATKIIFTIRNKWTATKHLSLRLHNPHIINTLCEMKILDKRPWHNSGDNIYDNHTRYRINKEIQKQLGMNY